MNSLKLSNSKGSKKFEATESAIRKPTQGEGGIKKEYDPLPGILSKWDEKNREENLNSAYGDFY